MDPAETTATPDEDQMRAAYEEQLSKITSTDMILQTVVALVNVAGRRLGLAGGQESERDLDQVRDAIDGARALMPILERRIPAETGQLRGALSQLQMAYAREVAPQAGREPHEPPAGDASKGPGPAQTSGRLWVPGR